MSYRHPNLSLEEIDFCFSSLNSILEKIDNEKPIGIVLTGDFNARSSYFFFGGGGGVMLIQGRVRY